MKWTHDDWLRDSRSPDWGPKVVKALIAYFNRDDPYLLAPARLVDARSELDPDGTSVLVAVYDHPQWTERTGLRRRLDRQPMTGEEDSPEAQIAAEIAIYEISEPLGSYYGLLVEDSSGVWWWGDGYRAVG